MNSRGIAYHDTIPHDSLATNFPQNEGRFNERKFLALRQSRQTEVGRAKNTVARFPLTSNRRMFDPQMFPSTTVDGAQSSPSSPV